MTYNLGEERKIALNIDKDIDNGILHFVAVL